jgi:anaerobic ribonucleoside-triphosphate reductase activating protein
MIKYIPQDTSVVFSEIPDEITLALNISNCQNNCIGCHTSYLRENIGTELTPEVLSAEIQKNSGISCVCFMGEGNDREALLNISQYIRREFPDLKTALYSGRVAVEDEIYDYFDYVKVGPYIESLGPLNSKTTNQRLYKNKEDITYKFWK